MAAHRIVRGSARSSAGSAGFTLVEIMVSMTIGLVLLSGIVSIFSASKRSARVNSAMATLQENARFALNQMERDIRMAGFRGCLSSVQSPYTVTPVLNAIDDPDAYANNFDTAVEGYYATGTDWEPELDPAIAAFVPAPSPANDVLTVRIPVGESYPVTQVMANDSATVSVAAPAVTPADLRPPAAVLISDCYAAATFRVTAATDGVLEHDDTANATTNLGRAFGTDAIVSRVQTVTYYVAASTNAPTNTETSLWRVQGNSKPEELVEGVERLRIYYGEDRSSPSDASADWFVPANRIHAAEMSNVVSVTLQLLMRTLEQRVALSADGSRAYFEGVHQPASTDRGLRRAYRSTVMLRNRAP